MATIGKLAGILSLNSSKWAKGLKTARKDSASFVRSVGAMSAKVAKFGAATAAVAGGGLAIMTRQSFKSIDITAKVADKLGIATDKLVGLRHAAELSGVKINTFDMGIQRMTRRLAEAAKDTGEAQGALKELGIDAKKLVTIPLDKQFMAIADAMEGIGRQSERVRLGFKIFDSEGVALINTLRGGSAALAKTQKEAEKLGLTFSRVAAAKIEMANNAMIRLWGLVKGVSNQIAINLAPFVTVMSNRLVEMGIAGQGMGLKVVNAFEGITKSVVIIIRAIDILRLTFNFLPRAISRSIEQISGFRKEVSDLGVSISRFLKIPALEEMFQKSADSATETAKVWGMVFDDIGEANKKLMDSIFDVSKTKRFFDEIRNQADAAARLIAESLAPKSLSLATAPAGAPGFEQIVRGHTALGGGAQKGRVPILGDPQQTFLLSGILEVLKGGTFARAS